MTNVFLSASALLALTGGTAWAQPSPPSSTPGPSSVTLYGIIDVGAYAKQYSGQVRAKNIDSGQMETSQLGFRGSEDLGNGLRANFDISTFFQADTGNSTRGIPGESFWSRNAWVGLSSPWGTVRAGRISTANFLNNIRFNPFGASSALSPTFLHTYQGSPVQPMATGSGATDSAWDNSVAYTSPSQNGFVLYVQAAPSEGGTAGRRVGGGVAYNSPVFSAMLTVDDISDATLTFPLSIPTLPGAVPPFVGTDFSTMQLGVSYDYKVVKLFGQFSRTEIEGQRGPAVGQTLDLDTLQLGLAAPVGNGRWLLSAARTSKELTAAADQDRTTVTGGYDYDLSKRTDAYAMVISDKVSNLSRGTGYTVGIRHRF